MSEVKRERICEVLNDLGRWRRVPLSAVLRGDIFRLWDAEGVPTGGVEELNVAIDDALQDDVGCWSVHCRPLSSEAYHG